MSGYEVSGWRHRFGRAAEEHVAELLQRHGVRLLASRFRAAGGEVDLIGMDDETLVFVEVRARRGRLVDPLESVDAHKQRRLMRAAAAFLRGWPGRRPAVRFDVVAVTTGSRGRVRARWVRDAFRGR